MQFLFFHLVDGNLVLINSNKNADCDFEKKMSSFLFIPKIVITVIF